LSRKSSTLSDRSGCVSIGPTQFRRSAATMYGSMQIGPVTVRPNVILAPMAGITDRPFRRMIRQLGGCGLTVSELLSVEAIVRRQRRTLEMIAADPVERPFAIQIYGSRPEAMADAALQAFAAGADIVDIN